MVWFSYVFFCSIFIENIGALMNKLFVVSHKNYEFPTDNGYEPIQVGKNLNSNSIRLKDSTGDNINHLNSSFCELTALYWIWKNNQNDIIGLVHYRRYFIHKNQFILLKNKKIASSNDLSLSNNIDLIIAKPRNYYITSIKKHYYKAHYQDDYILMRNEIIEQYPEYLIAFEQVMNGSKLSLYNMFIAKRKVIEPYFEWLFNILFALEKKIPYQDYDSYQKRVFGFMAERLFNVWIIHHKNNLNIEYRAVVNIEGENLFTKGIGLLKRHYFRK